MDSVVEIAVQIGLIALAINTVVIFHELGHLAAAIGLRVKVEVISLGLGKPILQYETKGGTLWKVGRIPLLGYIRFAEGELAREPFKSKTKRYFADTATWRKILILIAGPAFSLLLAAIGYFLVFYFVGVLFTSNAIGAITPSGPADTAGLRTGDKIVSIGDVSIQSFQEMQTELSKTTSDTVPVIVQRGKELHFLHLRVETRKIADRFGNTFQVKTIGVRSSQEKVRITMSAWKSLELAPQELGDVAWRTFYQLFSFITQLWTPKLDGLGGPIRIADVDALNYPDWREALFLKIAQLSIALSIVNLLPLPMSDGLHLAFASVEAARKRRLSERRRDQIFSAANKIMIIVAILTVASEYQTLVRWFSYRVF